MSESFLVHKDHSFLVVVLDFVSLFYLGVTDQCIWLFWVSRCLLSIVTAFHSFTRTDDWGSVSEALFTGFSVLVLVLYSAGFGCPVPSPRPPPNIYTHPSSFFKSGNWKIYILTSVFISLTLGLWCSLKYGSQFWCSLRVLKMDFETV